jgi:CRISPR-associated exonuclease Cas4
VETIEDIAISALEHYSYCPRQFGLIHVERVWRENELTLQGSLAHERADLPIARHERAVEVWRAVPLRSHRLHLYGRADIVEVLDDGTVLPVEYKRGDRRPSVHERVQLCAQALCLEEMLDVRIDEGALYHVASRKRIAVAIDAELRSLTKSIAAQVRSGVETGSCPPPIADVRCDTCSLEEDCLPQLEGALARTDRDVLYSVGMLADWAEDEP